MSMQRGLLPYHYSLAHRLSTEGELFIRPLAMDFPKDPKVENMTSQWMDGQILVSPVLSKDSRAEIYLPEGRWHPFDMEGDVIQGPHYESKEVKLEDVPAFVPVGTVLVLAGHSLRSSASLPGGDLEVQVYAGGNGNFTLVEDDGDDGKVAAERSRRSTTFVWNDALQELSWTAGSHAPKGSFQHVFLTVFTAKAGTSRMHSRSVPLSSSGTLSVSQPRLRQVKSGRFHHLQTTPGAMKSGDWICHNCGDLVFARNKNCRRCNQARPEASWPPGDSQAGGWDFLPDNGPRSIIFCFPGYPGFPGFPGYFPWWPPSYPPREESSGSSSSSADESSKSSSSEDEEAMEAQRQRAARKAKLKGREKVLEERRQAKEEERKRREEERERSARSKSKDDSEDALAQDSESEKKTKKAKETKGKEHKDRGKRKEKKDCDASSERKKDVKKKEKKTKEKHKEKTSASDDRPRKKEKAKKKKKDEKEKKREKPSKKKKKQKDEEEDQEDQEEEQEEECAEEESEVDAKALKKRKKTDSPTEKPKKRRRKSSSS
eukprot:s1932_g1.t1